MNTESMKKSNVKRTSTSNVSKKNKSSVNIISPNGSKILENNAALRASETQEILQPSIPRESAISFRYI